MGNPGDFGGASDTPSPTPVEKKQEAPAPPRELTPEEMKANEITAIRTRGNDHYKKKEWDQALACYDEVLEKDPLQISVLNNRIVSVSHMSPLTYIFYYI